MLNTSMPSMLGVKTEGSMGTVQAVRGHEGVKR